MTEPPRTTDDAAREWRAAKCRSAIAAKRAVLGSMLRDNRVIADVLTLLSEESFRPENHLGKIFLCIAQLFQSGKSADLVTVYEQLCSQNFNIEITPTLISDLWDAAPTSANALEYARIVQEWNLRTKLIETSSEIAESIMNDSRPVADVLEECQRKVFAITTNELSDTTITLQQALIEAERCYDETYAGGTPGIDTGFGGLNEIIGGFHAKTITLLAARPSQGKTALAIALAMAAAKAGTPVFFVSLEQTSLEIAQRILCSLAKVSSTSLRRGKLKPDEEARLLAVRPDLETVNLLLDDRAGQTVTRIVSSCRRHRLRSKIGFVVIDYLQLITPEDRKATTNDQLTVISSRLKQMAKELAIPVLALAQLNRDSDKEQRRPRLSDLRGSGSLEQDADVVLLMYPQSEKVQADGRSADLIQILVEKQRNGAKGSVDLGYIGEQFRFVDLGNSPGPWDGDNG